MAHIIKGDTTMENITPEQARAALEQANQPLPATTRSRQVHGLTVAAAGLLMGAYVSARAPLAGHLDTNIIWGIYAGLVIVVYYWQRRAAAVMPHGVRRLSFIGTLGSTILALAGIIVTEARRGEAEHTGTLLDQPLWMTLALLVVIAVPCLIAGHLIHRSKR